LIPLYNLGSVPWIDSQLLYHALPRLGRSGLFLLAPQTPYVCIGFHQDAAQATEYRIKRKPEDSEIDPQRPLLDLYNQIRACDPDDYPAYFYVEGQKVCIGLWRQDKPGSELDMI